MDKDHLQELLPKVSAMEDLLYCDENKLDELLLNKVVKDKDHLLDLLPIVSVVESLIRHNYALYERLKGFSSREKSLRASILRKRENPDNKIDNFYSILYNTAFEQVPVKGPYYDPEMLDHLSHHIMKGHFSDYELYEYFKDKCQHYGQRLIDSDARILATDVKLDVEV